MLASQAYAIAQWEYFDEDDHDHDQVSEYAQRLFSSPGQQDGLYWETIGDDEPSPLGPLVAYARTRRKLAEDELRHLGGRLIKAQEEERSRVGRDLHDDLSQRLAVFSIELEQLRRKLPGERDDLTCSVMSLITRAQDLASDIHRLSYELHPFKLDTLGLSAAIKGLCEEISNHRDLKIKFQQKGFPAALPPDVTLCIFRVAQEALHNIVKHSGAREAKVILTKPRKPFT